MSRVVSGYKGMWLFALFDLPTTSDVHKKNYTRFRKQLLKMGFDMFQFSVYGRYFSSEEASESSIKRIQLHLPPEGEVRVLMVTDRQFGKMQVFFGKMLQETEEPPEQTLLF